MATKAALALECTLNPDVHFCTKNYFYPDLPKAIQISQFDRPLAEHGLITIGSNGSKKQVRIKRPHGRGRRKIHP
jgi:aspartyl-tRNA(Asn)/glutamyl-tRNA(Gln) amidotransferase subunit B